MTSSSNEMQPALSARYVSFLEAKSRRTRRPAKKTVQNITLFANAKTGKTTYTLRFTSPVTGGEASSPYGAVSLDKAKAWRMQDMLTIAEGHNPPTRAVAKKKRALAPSNGGAGADLTIDLDGKAILTVAEAVSFYWSCRAGDMKRKPTGRNLSIQKQLLQVRFCEVVGSNKMLIEVTDSDINKALRRLNEKPGAKVNLYKALQTFFTRIQGESKFKNIRGQQVENPMLTVRKPDEPMLRERTLNDREIKSFWSCCDAKVFGPMFKLSLLTGARIGEVSGMKWNELKIENWRDDNEGGMNSPYWRVPGVRTKNKQAHIIHLSPLAIEQIRQATRIIGSPFVFTTNGAIPATGFSNGKIALDTRMIADLAGVKMFNKEYIAYRKAVTASLKPGGADLSLEYAEIYEAFPLWRVHDLRRTFATGCQQFTDELIIERLLNHRLPKLSRTYQTGPQYPQRKAALFEWSNRVSSFIDGGTSRLIDEQL